MRTDYTRQAPGALCCGIDRSLCQRQFKTDRGRHSLLTVCGNGADRTRQEPLTMGGNPVPFKSLPQAIEVPHAGNPHQAPWAARRLRKRFASTTRCPPPRPRNPLVLAQFPFPATEQPCRPKQQVARAAQSRPFAPQSSALPGSRRGQAPGRRCRPRSTRLPPAVIIACRL